MTTKHISPVTWVDLSAVADQSIRNSLLHAAQELAAPVRSYHDYWRILASPGRGKSVAAIIFADLNTCISRFGLIGRSRWQSNMRKLHPSIVAIAAGNTPPQQVAMVDDLVLASDGRLVICELKSNDRLWQRRCVARALAATRRDSLLSAEFVDHSWILEFGDGLRASLAEAAFPLSRDKTLLPDTAVVSETLDGLQVTDRSGHVNDIDATVLRALVDERRADELQAVAMDSTLALGSHLRRKRLKSGLTQVDLGLKSGLGQALISRLESGRHRPRFDTLRRYARALGSSVPDLLS